MMRADRFGEFVHRGRRATPDEPFYDFDVERDAHVASVEREADVEDVQLLVAAQQRIADELNRRRGEASLPARIAALRNTPPPELPPKPRQRPRARWIRRTF